MQREEYKILVVDDDMRLRALLETLSDRAELPGS